MEIGVISGTKKNQSTKLELADQIFAQDFNEALVHQVVMAYMAAGRAGTHAQKTRAEVSGGGAKPWKQKGMGRARAGTIRSPIWRTGGKTFAARTQDYSQKVNRKMYRGALRSIYSELIKQDRLRVVENLKIEQPKTKLFINLLNSWTSSDSENKSNPKTLIILEDVDANLILSSRNIPDVTVCTRNNISPVDLIAHDMVIVESSTLKKIEESLS